MKASMIFVLLTGFCLSEFSCEKRGLLQKRTVPFEARTQIIPARNFPSFNVSRHGIPLLLKEVYPALFLTGPPGWTPFGRGWLKSAQKVNF
jgi:hypothetical protein